MSVHSEHALAKETPTEGGTRLQGLGGMVEAPWKMSLVGVSVKAEGPRWALLPGQKPGGTMSAPQSPGTGPVGRKNRGTVHVAGVLAEVGMGW